MTRDDVREFGAVPIALALLGFIAMILFAFTHGLWVWLAVGMVILVALAAVALIAMARPHHPPAYSAPASPAARPDGVHRVLVVADESCAASDLAPALAGGRTAAFVVAPALGTRAARWTGDERAYAQAAEHLAATLEALTELHVEAGGHVGPHDPLQAADDGLREFEADEILFAVHPDGEANWLERGVAESARDRYRIPVRELTVART